MKKIICLLTLFMALFSCCDDGNNLSDSERKAKMEQLYLLQSELAEINSDIAQLQEKLMGATGGVAIVLEMEIKEKKQRKSEIEQEIQKLKKELGID